tara:strand:- start:1732 stop:2001 length:270 start_codon:yes stop_codon:yes gene_type:complete
MSHKETVNKVLDQLLNTIEEQNESIRKLKEETERLDSLWVNGIRENNDLCKRIVKLGYNPLVSSYLFEDTFKTLGKDPLDQKILDLFKD